MDTIEAWSTNLHWSHIGIATPPMPPTTPPPPHHPNALDDHTSNDKNTTSFLQHGTRPCPSCQLTDNLIW